MNTFFQHKDLHK